MSNPMFYVLTCGECKQIIAYALHPFPALPINPLCSLCADSIAHMASVLELTQVSHSIEFNNLYKDTNQTFGEYYVDPDYECAVHWRRNIKQIAEKLWNIRQDKAIASLEKNRKNSK